MATGAPFTDDVRRFILTSIPSVPYLEAMLLLRNLDTGAWDGKALAQRLYMSEKAAADLLSELHAAGVVQLESAGYRYAPQSDELRDKIDRLADVYSSHLIEVANLIHSKTSKKAHQFADAFKWRKES
jgi:Mn-dependent DtxR family transcriptional regulator